jgi:hypothetical protein
MAGVVDTVKKTIAENFGGENTSVPRSILIDPILTFI